MPDTENLDTENLDTEKPEDKEETLENSGSKETSFYNPVTLYEYKTTLWYNNKKIFFFILFNFLYYFYFIYINYFNLIIY